MSLDLSADRVPGAIWDRTDGRDGQTYATGANPKLCLHTTETKGLPDYPSPPHLTIDISGTSSQGFGAVWQHVPLSKGAYALRSPGGGQSPNYQAGPMIQVELIAYAKNTPSWSDAQYELVGAICAAAIRDRGVPFVFCPLGWQGSGGYGETAITRYQSFSQLKAFSGILAHQNVWANSHWDAGALSPSKLQKAITQAQGDDMPLTDADIDRIAEATTTRILTNPISNSDPTTFLKATDRTYRNVGELVTAFREGDLCGDPVLALMSTEELAERGQAIAAELIRRDAE